MKRRVLGALGALVLLLAAAPARAEKALWLRNPALSPDGKQVAFSYRGDIWTVSANGGTATTWRGSRP